ncbi:hypothetical protein CL616_02130 [archaeon]|nr:hypothetical protein [archaeon]|tara:strand:+ start:129 stop:518 length:390 start_codon:yes stop_codon:yes gene_type:complete
MKRVLDKSLRIGLGVGLLIFSIFSIYSLVVGVSSWYVSGLFLEIVLIVLGVVFLREVFVRGFDFKEKMIDLVISLFLIFFGLFPLGLDYEIFRFLPFAVEISVNPVVLVVVLMAFGAYLIIDEVERIVW